MFPTLFRNVDVVVVVAVGDDVTADGAGNKADSTQTLETKVFP
jgi:hypothetical protein